MYQKIYWRETECNSISGEDQRLESSSKLFWQESNFFFFTFLENESVMFNPKTCTSRGGSWDHTTCSKLGWVDTRGTARKWFWNIWRFQTIREFSLIAKHRTQTTEIVRAECFWQFLVVRVKCKHIRV